MFIKWEKRSKDRFRPVGAFIANGEIIAFMRDTVGTRTGNRERQEVGELVEKLASFFVGRAEHDFNEIFAENANAERNVGFLGVFQWLVFVFAVQFQFFFVRKHGDKVGDNQSGKKIPFDEQNRLARKSVDFKGRGAFPNDNSVLRILYLRAMDISKKWGMPVPNWAVVRGKLDIVMPGWDVASI